MAQILAAIAVFCMPGTTNMSLSSTVKRDCQKRMMTCVSPLKNEKLSEVEERLWECAKKDKE